MSSKDLITLTNSPVASLGGAFPTGYITRLSQSQFNDAQFGLHLQHQSSNGLMRLHLNFIPFAGARKYENLESLDLRMVCHALLDYLPEEGLEEIKDSLLEAIKFYREQQTVSEPFHLNDSFEVAIGEGYERPVFQIAED